MTRHLPDTALANRGELLAGITEVTVEVLSLSSQVVA